MIKVYLTLEESSLIRLLIKLMMYTIIWIHLSLHLNLMAGLQMLFRFRIKHSLEIISIMLIGGTVELAALLGTIKLQWQMEQRKLLNVLLKEMLLQHLMEALKFDALWKLYSIIIELSSVNCQMDSKWPQVIQFYITPSGTTQEILSNRRSLLITIVTTICYWKKTTSFTLMTHPWSFLATITPKESWNMNTWVLKEL